MSGVTGRLLAQAKLNLILRVLGKELSGYHQLETVFVRLELGDTVTVRCGGTSRSLECDESALQVRGQLGPPNENLAYRAAVAYADAAGWPRGFRIDIEKRIPVGGGLGGGSADAGAVLRILDALAPQPLPPDRFRRVAFALGADVQFLATEMPMALGWGRGERLHPLPALPVRDIALAIFPFGVMTKDAFGWLDADRHGDIPLDATIQSEMLMAWDRVAVVMRNDLETPVAQRHSPIRRVLDAIRKVTPVAQLTGSGSTVFGVFDAPTALSFGQDARVIWTRNAARVVPVERIG